MKGLIMFLYNHLFVFLPESLTENIVDFVVNNSIPIIISAKIMENQKEL